MSFENVQIVPLHPKIRSLKERNSAATHEVIFLSTLDPLGLSSYLITKSNGESQSAMS